MQCEMSLKIITSSLKKIGLSRWRQRMKEKKGPPNRPNQDSEMARTINISLLLSHKVQCIPLTSISQSSLCINTFADTIM